MELIEDMKNKNLYGSESVFYSSNGNIFTDTYYRKVLIENAKKCKIKKHITPHSLRHTHISLLAEKNVPIKAIMERVGHVDERITLQIYTHVTKKMEQTVKDKLNEISF